MAFLRDRAIKGRAHPQRYSLLNAAVKHIVPLGAFALEAQQVAIGEADVDAPPTTRDGAGSSGSLDISDSEFLPGHSIFLV